MSGVDQGNWTTSPTRECDVVMKGGITSGVIYPRAVCELAKTYRLRSVGGSSAGAIAAAGAAAAEYGRQTGSSTGFELLDQLPTDITKDSPAGGSVMLRLFQPTEANLPLYRSFTAGMGQPNRTVSVVRALLRGYGGRAMACAAPGVLLGAFCVLGCLVALLGRGAAGAAVGWGCAIALVGGGVAGTVLALAGVVAGTAWGVLGTVSSLPNGDFGMCTGMPGAGAGDAEALTPWLHAKFQAMAGRAAGDDVLTFGQLADKGIELKMMTTNLTRRQPMPMPWAANEYFFEPAEIRALFPEDVVSWMVDDKHWPTANPDGTALTPSQLEKRDWLRAQAGAKRPWPAPEHLPVIVATRMSLSFPVLVTAVPLHAVNWARLVKPKTSFPDPSPHADTAPPFEVNWFSDGGICANLPVHFFDSSLPTRPTFAIDLQKFSPPRTKSPDQAENCFIATRNDQGLNRPWTTLGTNGIGALVGFLNQIVDTARGWFDAAQLVTPGYRDRVVTIFTDTDEGGMNLTMDAPTVNRLAERGQAAAQLLVDQFGPTPAGQPAWWGWNNQRWTRFRTATAGFDHWVGKFRAGYASPGQGATPYPDLIDPAADPRPPSYPFANAANAAMAHHLTNELVALADGWNPPTALSGNAPRPRPQLRLSPDDGAAGLAEHTIDATDFTPGPPT